MINQSIKYSLGLSALGTFLFFASTGHIGAIGLLISTLWGSVNLYLINMLVKNFLLTRNHAYTSFLLLIKFPLLYFIGYQLLQAKIWNPWFVALGLFVTFLGLMISSLLQLSGKFA